MFRDRVPNHYLNRRKFFSRSPWSLLQIPASRERDIAYRITPARSRRNHEWFAVSPLPSPSFRASANEPRRRESLSDAEVYFRRLPSRERIHYPRSHSSANHARQKEQA